MLRTMDRRLVVLALAVIAVGLLWWASGLGRVDADPRTFFTQEQIDRANAYRGPKNWAVLGSTAVGLGVLLLLALTPVGDRLLSPFRGWPWALAALATVAVVVVARALARLPFSFWSGHVHERRWGFSTQGAAGWFADWGKGLGVSLVVSAVLFVGLLGLIRWLPRAWPIVAAVAVGLFVAGMSFLYPVLIEPIFHRFEPLRDPTEVRELQALSDRAGVPVREVLVADASRRTTKENAYVSGYGATRRLVVYDTLLDEASVEEVRLVVAHELGHRRLRHVELMTALGAMASAGAVFLLAFLLRSDGVLSAARATGPGDPRVIPSVMLVVAMITLLAVPPSNWLSRYIERAADGFALELTGDRETYERTMRGLALRNLGDLTPGPIAYRFLYTHPAPAERLAYADEVLPGSSSPSRNAGTSEPSDPTA